MTCTTTATRTAPQSLALTNAALIPAETEALLVDLVSVDDRDSRGTLALVGGSRGASSLLQRLHELSYQELAQVIVMWMGRLTSPVTRRVLMSKLSAAFTVAGRRTIVRLARPGRA